MAAPLQEGNFNFQGFVSNISWKLLRLTISDAHKHHYYGIGISRAEYGFGPNGQHTQITQVFLRNFEVRAVTQVFQAQWAYSLVGMFHCPPGWISSSRTDSWHPNPGNMLTFYFPGCSICGIPIPFQVENVQNCLTLELNSTVYFSQ